MGSGCIPPFTLGLRTRISASRLATLFPAKQLQYRLERSWVSESVLKLWCPELNARFLHHPASNILIMLIKISKSIVLLEATGLVVTLHTCVFDISVPNLDLATSEHYYNQQGNLDKRQSTYWNILKEEYRRLSQGRKKLCTVTVYTCFIPPSASSEMRPHSVTCN